jgi:molybdopterin molybdotransferase
MSGFVLEVRALDDCIRHVAEALAFPWDLREKTVGLNEALSMTASRDVLSRENSPPFTRSLRDGYALSSRETVGASNASPVFLKLAGEVSMGAAPSFSLSGGEAALMPTGGMMPEGADSVVMLEDADEGGGWVEIRKAVQAGENIISAGEEAASGDVLLSRGEMIDCASLGLLSSMGISETGVLDARIGIISTGDEIVPAGTFPLPDGAIRDANSHILRGALARYGWASESYGIIPDDRDKMESAVELALGECDVVLLSGGSSVGARDHAARIIESQASPGLLVRGVNMTPGKPTLIGGSAERKKLIAGLPGHPLSCLTAALFVVLPLLLAMCGAKSDHVGRRLKLPLAEDAQGRTGPDEFIPMRIDGGRARPVAAKSGYVMAARRADGFIRMRPNVETLRRGEEAEVWIW